MCIIKGSDLQSGDFRGQIDFVYTNQQIYQEILKGNILEKVFFGEVNAIQYHLNLVRTWMNSDHGRVVIKPTVTGYLSSFESSLQVSVWGGKEKGFSGDLPSFLLHWGSAECKTRCTHC